MAFYTLTIESFHIESTRSRSNDTDEVTGVLQLGNETLPAQSRFNGDVDEGDYPIGFVFGPRLLSQPNTALILSYAIYNGDLSRLPKGLNDISTDLVTKALDSMVKERDPDQGDLADFTNFPGNQDAGNGEFDFDDGSWIKVLEFAALASFLFPNCDGFVAIGAIGKEKKRWDSLIDAAGGVTLRKSVRYPGSDSPAGCGSNSDYSVRWSITREGWSGPGPKSLRSFLSIHQQDAKNGLRALVPGEPTISVRGLLS